MAAERGEPSRLRVRTAVLRGVEAIPVTAEVDLCNGIPGIRVVGTPDQAVNEAASRVRCAIRACGYDLPRLSVTVNLAPADIRKTGTGFELPIAIGILAATGQIPTVGLDGCLVVGELGLDGDVRPVRGAMAFALLARRQGLSLLAGGLDCSQAAAAGCGTLSLDTLGRLRLGAARLEPARPAAVAPTDPSDGRLDYADVMDQEAAKRAFVIAAAGGHGLLMMGPPGSGKTMLARRMPTILPPLDDPDRLEALLVHSVAGQDALGVARGVRPFRAPHHSLSVAGLVGGGRPVLPGEVSLAHHGVLFLDELPEFQTNALQALRQPIEDGEVRLVRADGSYTFPSRFQLVAAANPCPCGHYGDPGRTCTCAPGAVERYQGRVGGALLDRIDVFVSVARPAAGRVLEGSRGMSSAQMAGQVREAREFRAWRAGRRGASAGGVPGLGLSTAASARLEGMANRLRLGGRAVTRTARVARTIADLAHREQVGVEEVDEACAYRSRLAGEGGESHGDASR